jgi:LysM repeat protein
VSTFTIRSDSPKISFMGEMGDGPALVTDGYGGWEVVARPQEIGITEWAGRNPMAIEIPFVIDNWFSNSNSAGINTEQQVDNLERLSGLGSHDRPPICKVNGKGVIPHDLRISSLHRWVIENIAWSRELEIRSPSSMRRLRCGGTITIRQFIEADALDRLAAKKKTKKKKTKKKPKAKTHTVKANESLAHIASIHYDDAGKWHIIGDANGLRDPNSLVVGDVLFIP